MLTITGSDRRAFLKVGTLGLAGLSLDELLRAKAFASESKGVVKDKSVIFLFMQGGPSQYETFDPKMSAPAEIRSTTGEISTSLPSITFGSTFTKLAKLANKMTVVRSFVGGDGNHDIKPIMHKDTLNANLGSIYARIAGTNHPTSGMPTNVALFPKSVVPESQPMQTGFGNFLSAGLVGNAYAPYSPEGKGVALQNMQLRIPRERLDDRNTLMKQFDKLKRDLDTSGSADALDRYKQQAIDMVLRGSADAFDLSKEDPRVVQRYDTSHMASPESINKKWNNHKFYVDHVRTLGKLLVLARRLCEAGCGFVTVTTNFVWDMHADSNNAPAAEAMPYVGGPVDHAVSAFIEDCEDRGLSDKIMLVATGEMGRTPRVNKNGGRDHWGGIAPLLITGGGLPMGQVIGQSNRDGGQPSSTPITRAHLVSTIMHTLFDVPQLRIQRGVPDDVGRVIMGHEPIRELIDA